MLQNFKKHLLQKGIHSKILRQNLLLIDIDYCSSHEITAENQYNTIEIILKKDLSSGLCYSAFINIPEEAIHRAIENELCDFKLNPGITVDYCCNIVTVSLHFLKQNPVSNLFFDQIVDDLILSINAINYCINYIEEKYTSIMAKSEYDPNHWL